MSAHGPMGEQEYRAIINRQRRLPEQLEAARRKVAALECEARRYGMGELLRNPAHLDRAWDRAITEAQDDARLRGGSIGFGEAFRDPR